MAVLGFLVTAVTCMLAITNYALSASDSGAHAPTIAKKGCEPRCGKVNIPFPFGIGSSCSLNEHFEIFCDKSASPPRPFLKHTKWEVLNISDFGDTDWNSRYRGQSIRINNPISFWDNCGENKSGKALDLTGMPFSLSMQNTFVAVSCGVLAKIYSRSDNIFSQQGCWSNCSSRGYDEKTASNGILCNGTDCCETSASYPDALDILFDANTTTIKSAGYQPQYERESKCKFAFVVDDYNWSNYKISSTASFQEIHGMGYVPVVLDWYIYNTDIKKIFGQRNMSRLLSENRFQYCEDYVMSDYENPRLLSKENEYPRLLSKENEYPRLLSKENEYQWRVQCYCIGLLGSPYLDIGGCSQDINECEEYGELCDRGATCVNTYGSYHCSYKRMYILIGVGSSLGALFLLFSTWGLYKFVKKRKDINRERKFFKRNGGLLLQQQISSVEGNVQKTKLFSSNELEKATNNFSIDRILGQGGQGTVYKGMLVDGKIVAIKKSKMVDEAQLSEFINEVVILSQINHRNVVQLLGCCLETDVPLLVYEFISNGTLAEYIHERNEEFPFTWKMRLRVAIEVAGALSYLHSAASFPIYHRDIKSTNILLDEKYRAKVADFGTSRTISVEQTHLTTIVYGTIGYLDPEYFQSSQFTDKSDVYSFGVVLVELLTGQKAISSIRPREGKNLATYFIMTMEARNVFDIADPKLLEDASKEEIEGVANIAQRCLNLSGRNRPTMKEVATLLEGIQRSEATSIIAQQNHEDVKSIITEFNKPWDVETESALDKTASTHTLLLQELPLLSFESH